MQKNIVHTHNRTQSNQEKPINTISNKLDLHIDIKGDTNLEGNNLRDENLSPTFRNMENHAYLSNN